MGLSAPLALAAALFVALPVIAHLVRRADVERRVLPSVALLRRVVVRDRRRARVTEPWLLALRVVAVLAAALALAGPFLVERVAYGDGSALSLVIVLDDSASMARRESGGESVFDEARDRARAIIRSLGEGSEVAIVLAGAPPRVVAPRSTDRAIASTALDHARVGARRTDVPGAIALATRQLAGAHLAARRVVVLSDFAFESDAPLPSSGGVELEAVPLGASGPFDNLGIVDARASVDPLERGAWSVVVEVQAASDPAPPSVTVAIETLAPGAGLPAPDALELARVSAPIEGGRARATLRFTPPGGGDRVAVRLLDTRDASPFDDERVVALEEPRASRVVVVEPAGRHTGRFIARALAALSSASSSVLASTIDVDGLSSVPSGRLAPSDAPQPDPLAGADVLVLASAVPSSGLGLEAVRGFVEGGGGLLVAPSATTRAGDLAALEALLPARVGAVEVAPPRDPAEPSVRRGAAGALLPSGPTGLETMAIRSLLRLEAPDDEVVLSSAAGSPLLVVDREHRRAVLAIGLDDEMSDLPFRPGFLPLAASLVHALARPGILPDRPFIAGEAPSLAVDEGVTLVELVTPSGEVLRRRPDHGAVSLDDLADPGAYTLRAEANGQLRVLTDAALVLVPPAEEIDLRPHPPADAATRDPDAREGEAHHAIARWFFLALGLLAALEGFWRHQAWLARRAPWRRVA